MAYSPEHVEHLAAELRCIAQAISEHTYGAPARVGVAADRLSDAAADLAAHVALARIEAAAAEGDA